MKKKIFFIMSTDDYSGAEAVNFSIINGLKDKFDFYWVSQNGNINNFLEEQNIKWIEIETLNIKEIKRIVKEYKPDILHSTDFKATVICALTRMKVPIIAHLHNNSPWLKSLNIYSIVFLFSALKAKKILTVSESIEKEYIFSKFLRNKIECISNPISRKKILDKVDNFDKKIVDKKYDICCVARLTEQKNPKKFINIVEKIKGKFPDIRCIWIGKGELEEECRKILKEKKLERNINFVGFKKNPYKYMIQSKIFMLTSDWEGFGLVAFEALTLGLPAIVSNVGGLPSIIDTSCGFLCDNSKQFIDDVSILLDDKQLEEYSKNAINRSKKIDNYNKYIKKIDKIYRSCL